MLMEDLRTTSLERGNLMTDLTAARRLGRWRPALAVVVAAGALLAVADGASANVYTPVDGPGLQAAITSANSNPGPDTIKLASKNYQPSVPMTITDTLTITGDPQFQPPGQNPQIDGTFVNPLQSDLFTVNPGVSATFKAVSITGSSDIGFGVIRAKGTVELDNLALSGNNGTELVVDSGGTATANDANISDGTFHGIDNSGTLVLNNSTVANNSSGGITTSGTLRLNNTIIANNNPFVNGSTDCVGTPTTSTITSWDSDGTCAVAHTGDPMLDSTNMNGGPSPSAALLPGSPAINAGTNSICPTTDQRFFVRSDGQCDIGAYEAGAARDTTAPTCVVSALRAGPPKQQDVTATDSGSGLGPDAITNVAITNGTVAFTPFTSPSRAGLVLTATKTDQTQVTRWSFTATDWAGNVKNCT
jgi:hypothetical protein